MSYYFTIIGTADNPLFEYEFGTSRSGGDGVARFREEQRAMNQFIAHSSLDIVEEVQWTTGAMYVKYIDRFYNNYIACFLTGAGAKFILVHCPDPGATHNAHLYPLGSPALNSSSATLGTAGARDSIGPGGAGGGAPGSSGRDSAAGSRSSSASATPANSIAANPTSPAAEEAVRQFFADVYENWVKTVMSPFYSANMPIRSEVFRTRVAAAGRKYL